MPPKRTGFEGLYAAKSTFSVTIDGTPVVIRRGQVVEAGDPVLVGREGSFEPFVPKIRNYAGRVEQATAAPGERRT